MLLWHSLRVLTASAVSQFLACPQGKAAREKIEKRGFEGFLHCSHYRGSFPMFFSPEGRFSLRPFLSTGLGTAAQMGLPLGRARWQQKLNKNNNKNSPHTLELMGIPFPGFLARMFRLFYRSFCCCVNWAVSWLRNCGSKQEDTRRALPGNSLLP